MTGSSGRQRVPAEALAHYAVVIPNKEVAEGFGQSVQPLLARASNAARESRTLAATRDALLSKLISGEVRVEKGSRFADLDSVAVRAARGGRFIVPPGVPDGVELWTRYTMQF